MKKGNLNMARISVEAQSTDDLYELFLTLFRERLAATYGSEDTSAPENAYPAPAPASDLAAPKATRARKTKPEVPDPIKPTLDATAAASDAPDTTAKAEWAAPETTTATTVTANPTAAISFADNFANPTVAPAAPSFPGVAAGATAVREVLAKVSNHLKACEEKFGTDQIVRWTLGELGLSPEVTRDDLYNKHLPQQDDKILLALYGRADGK